LFTSEGCSSCPPAEQWINDLKGHPRLWKDFVPVAFHVDYWDYIGWKDPFASTRHSIRQQKYKRLGNLSQVYTPGMMLDGKEWRRWRNANAIKPSNEKAGSLSVAVSNDRVTARYTPATDLSGDELILNVAVLGFDLVSDVRAGENAGRRLQQEFVVLGHTTQSSSNGTWELVLPDVDPSHAMTPGIAVWVSKRGRLAPIQATGGLL
jgi:hypothetical protein